MDKKTFVEESPKSLHRPRDNVSFDDQEAGVAVVDINRIEKVYR